MLPKTFRPAFVSQQRDNATLAGARRHAPSGQEMGPRWGHQLWVTAAKRSQRAGFAGLPACPETPAMQGFPGSGRSRTRTWDLFLIRNISCPLQSPNSRLLPANRRDRAGGRGLEGTGWDNLVAPPWPHGRRSSARCRVARQRTLCRRYGQTRTLRRRAAARPDDRVQRGEARRVELVDHAAVGVDEGVAMTRARALSPSRCLAPQQRRLPSYLDLGGAAEQPAALGAIWWRAGRRAHRGRSGRSGRHSRLRGARRRARRAGSSPHWPGRDAPRPPPSSTEQRTTAAPARRPSPPARPETPRGDPAGRQHVGRQPGPRPAGPGLRISVITPRVQVVHCHQTLDTSGRRGRRNRRPE
jgi:hypothetical protein